jgi:hypothetical protein
MDIEVIACECAVCQVCRRYLDEGVPLAIVMSFIGLVQAEEIPEVEIRANRMNVMLADWQRLRAAAVRMEMLGLVTDAEFQEAVESSDPTLSMNLYTRLLDFSKRQTN